MPNLEDIRVGLDALANSEPTKRRKSKMNSATAVIKEFASYILKGEQNQHEPEVFFEFLKNKGLIANNIKNSSLKVYYRRAKKGLNPGTKKQGRKKRENSTSLRAQRDKPLSKPEDDSTKAPKTRAEAMPAPEKTRNSEANPPFQPSIFND